MAKRKQKKEAQAELPTEAVQDQPQIHQEQPKVDQPKRVVYTWPSRSRCPRCNSLDTVRTTNVGSVQHRRCRVPVCGKTYKVPGSVA